MLPGGAELLKTLPDPFEQCSKLASIRSLKVLVLHGEADTISPYEQGHRLHAACDISVAARFEHFARVGHNDIHASKAYVSAFSRFVTDVVGNWKPPDAP